MQHYLPPSQAAVGISIPVFVQNLFGAVFITVANTIFQSTLRSEITAHVPSVNPEAAIAAGGSADAVRALAPPASPELEAILEAYSTSFGHVFYLLAACCVAAFLSAFGMGWVDVRKKAKSESGRLED